ncbi:MAG: hypothetical protein FWC18_01870 [Cystobacterineae bacterium]|nr:hypothetical protein [Cystobacterineae bacterium]
MDLRLEAVEAPKCFKHRQLGSVCSPCTEEGAKKHGKRQQRRTKITHTGQKPPMSS